MTVMDDKYLALRFASQPEFLLRLDDFVASYALADRPALIVQARPTSSEPIPESAFDTEAFRRGIRTSRAWWHGFRSSYGPLPTFHGTASLRNVENPGWANELHRDGHFIAGIWELLPRRYGDADIVALSDFYAELFKHFAALVQATFVPSSTMPEYVLTATLINATQVHFWTRSDFEGEKTFGPLRKQILQWRIYSAVVGSEEWSAAAEAIGGAMLGAFGVERV